MQPQTRNAFLTAVLALALGACSVYSPEIRQGNYIDNDKFAQVKPGMTREQVRFLLGPPMIADAFHRAQWDYYFSLENQYVKSGLVRRHFVVRFDGDYVASVEELKPNSKGNEP
jgi:outer membrane protein assembly factor BamE